MNAIRDAIGVGTIATKKAPIWEPDKKDCSVVRVIECNHANGLNMVQSCHHVPALPLQLYLMNGSAVRSSRFLLGSGATIAETAASACALAAPHSALCSNISAMSSRSGFASDGVWRV